MEKISILTPTRNRPAFVGQMIKSCVETSTHPELLEFVFYIDNDDQASIEYFGELVPYLKKRNESQITVISGDRIVLSQTWNECYKVSTGAILHHCGDDLRFKTDGWDNIVREKFNEYEDRIVFVFGDDGILKPGSFGTHGFVHRKWAEAVGYFVPPYFSSDHNDSWLNDVAQSIDRHEFVDIYTEHLHPVAGKHTWDQTHRERLERHRNDNVDELYGQLANKRLEDADKLRSAMQGSSTAV